MPGDLFPAVVNGWCVPAFELKQICVREDCVVRHDRKVTKESAMGESLDEDLFRPVN